MEAKQQLKISTAIEQQYGLHFQVNQFHELETKILAAVRDLNIKNPDKFHSQIISGTLSPHEEEILLNNLTIGETYFFREPATLEVFKTILLPPLFG